MNVSADDEFGDAEVVEIRRPATQGALRPLVCVCDDGHHYYVKPFNCGGWPLSMEWICARLGRLLEFRIPNYRRVRIGSEIIDAWNSTGAKVFVEPGIGFGSRMVESADDANPELLARVEVAERNRILWFDWWIRHGDRRTNNPNVLWSHGDNSYSLIDHEKAGDPRCETEFWETHLFASNRAGLPLDFIEKARKALPELAKSGRSFLQIGHREPRG